MKIKTLLTSAGILALSCPVWADSQVTVHALTSGKTLTIEHAQRLSQVVTVSNLPAGIWWQGAVISEPQATAVIQQQYQQTLQQLNAWAATESVDQAASIRTVIQQLQAIKVTGRQFVPLDPDLVRTRDENNPRLEGRYSLWLPARPTTVTLLGAIEGTGKISWQAGRSVRDYLAGRERLTGADRNIAVVIRPDGSIQQAPVAYWNHRHVEPEPGSIIWVGFSSWATPGEFEKINQQIVSVLTHRIPD